MRRRKSLKGLFLTLAAVFAIGVFSTIWFYYSYILIEVRHVPMDFRVASSVGINADTDGLHFGKTLPGGSSMRKLDLANNEDFPLKIRIVNTGNISAWLLISEHDFVLLPGQNRTVYYNLEVPWEAPYGSYNGTSTYYIKRSLKSP